MPGVIVTGVLVFLTIIVLATLAKSSFTVRTQENVIVERFGKRLRVARPGLNFKMPWIDKITPPISLRVQQLEVNIESKTKDNVFVTVPVAVQYYVPEANVEDAYYRLSDPQAQIRSYVFDVVRSALSQLELDQAFESKDDIAQSVERTLSAQMRVYGFEIVNTLVTDISPDPRVRDSMNSINAAQRDREAALSLAEADKIKRVTQAEAEAEAKRLQGVGIAAQRRAIAEGIAAQYEMLREAGIEGTAEQLLLMTQYFDTMQDVARNSNTNVLYLPSNPGAMGGMFDEIRSSLLQSQGAAPAFEDFGDAGSRENPEEDEEKRRRRAELRARREAQKIAEEAKRAQERAKQAQQSARAQQHGGSQPQWAPPGQGQLPAQGQAPYPYPQQNG